MSHRPFTSTLAAIVWWVLGFNLWGFAFLGSLFFVIGMLAFYLDVPLSTFGVGGVMFQGPEQKQAWLVFNAAFATLGIGFAWLHWSGRLRFQSDGAKMPERGVPMDSDEQP